MHDSSCFQRSSRSKLILTSRRLTAPVVTWNFLFVLENNSFKFYREATLREI